MMRSNESIDEIKSTIINEIDDKIDILKKNENLFDYEQEGFHERVIELLDRAIETIKSLVSSEGIDAVRDSVDALYDLGKETEDDLGDETDITKITKISEAIDSLGKKISEMDHDSVRLMEAYYRHNASIFTTSARIIFNRSASAAQVRETLTERAERNSGGASKRTLQELGLM